MSDKESKKSAHLTLPIIKVDDVAFPGVTLKIGIPATGSLRHALTTAKQVFIATRKDDSQPLSPSDEVHETGVIANVMMATPDGPACLDLTVGVSSPAKLLSQSDDFNTATVEPRERNVEVLADAAYFDEAQETLKQLGQYTQKHFPHAVEHVGARSEAVLHKTPDLLPYVILVSLDSPVDTKLEVLSIADPKEQLKFVQSVIAKADLEATVATETNDEMKKRQEIFMIRQQQSALDKRLAALGESDDEDDLEKLVEKVRNAGMPPEALKKCEADLKKLKRMGPSDPNGNVLRNYLDEMVAYPWNKKSEGNLDLKHAKEVLDADHSGLEKPKEAIIERLAVQQRTGKSGAVIGLEGPPGVGKTSLGESIAKAMGREFVKVSLGGVHEESTIRGHRRTYLGAEAGRIVEALKKAGTNNPVVLLDEVDKLGSDNGRGGAGAVEAALLELLDPSQNRKFHDHYLDVDVDLSDVTFLVTANYLENVSAPLLDRINWISVEAYTDDEKMDIAKEHLIPKKTEEAGLRPSEFSISDAALQELITDYTKEAGVRSLQKKIGKLADKAVVEIDTTGTASVEITPENIEKYLGKSKVMQDRIEDEDLVGHGNGLYVSGASGGILPFDAILIPVKPGEGRLEITGMLKDVMKESSRDAYDYVRANAKELGIPREAFENNIVRIKANDGATPKDGPSAGLLMATVITSVLTDIPIRRDIAMTGEIGLTGKSMPIGGMKEKLTGALAAGVKTVFVPQSNYDRDMEDVPEKVKQGLTVIPVKHEMEVLKQALVRQPQPLPEEQLIASSAFAQVADREELRALIREELSNIFAGAAGTAREPANDAGRRRPAAVGAKARKPSGP